MWPVLVPSSTATTSVAAPPDGTGTRSQRGRPGHEGYLLMKSETRGATPSGCIRPFGRISARMGHCGVRSLTSTPRHVKPRTARCCIRLPPAGIEQPHGCPAGQRHLNLGCRAAVQSVRPCVTQTGRRYVGDGATIRGVTAVRECGRLAWSLSRCMARSGCLLAREQM